jgi:subtilisin family serine protease
MASCRLPLVLIITALAGGYATTSNRDSNTHAPEGASLTNDIATATADASRILVRFELSGINRPLSAATRSTLKALQAEITDTLCDGRISIVTLGGGTDVRIALARLRALPEVRYAVPNHDVTLSFVPNDVRFSSQWALKSSGGFDIGATLAWDQTTGTANTLVAIMDTGVDYTHPDLYLAVPINNAEIPTSLGSQLVDTNADGQIDFTDLNSLNASGDVVLNGSGVKFNSTLVSDRNGNGYIDAADILVAPWTDGVDNDSNGRIDDLVGWNFLNNNNNPVDTNGHGTHVAGIVGARGNNIVGVAGVNWRARLLPLKFHNGSGGHASEAIQAINYAVRRGAKVINSSWGINTANPALYDAVQWAGENGAVVVAAAGNAGANLDLGQAFYYPAQYQLPNVIGVASLESSGVLTSDSNYGPNSIAIAAPGVNILSTALGGDYVNMTGTSMAAPHVTGVVSLLAGLYPTQSPAWLVDRVLSTARALPSLTGKVATGGMLDAFAAIDAPSVAGPRIVSATPVGDVAAAVDRISVTFDRPIATATFGINDVTVTGPSGSIIPTGITAVSSFTFEIRFATQTALGTYSARVGPAITDTLSRPMDQDRDGNAGEPQDDQFALAFREVPPPQFQIIDNGDPGFGVTSGWINYSGGGAYGDLAFIQSGSGSEKATWTFIDLAPGEYRVSTTWLPYSNRPVDARYTVSDEFGELATVPVNQQVGPSGFVEAGIAWQDLGGIYYVTGDRLIVELSNLVTPTGSYVIADAVRVERIGAIPPGPEVQVLVDGTSMPDGASTIDFGRAALGSAVTRTVAVRNLGTTDLTLGAINVPAGFSLVSGFGSTILAPGQSTSFIVQLNGSAEGVFAGSLSFDSNDVDESPFDLTVTGTVSLYPTPFVVDDGDPTFYTTSAWIGYTGAGAQGDLSYKQSGSGAGVARWTFSNLAPGQYRVAATWQPYSNRPTDAVYGLYGDGATLAMVHVNQQQSPASFAENGVAWQDFGTTYLVSGDALVVELSDLALPSGSYLIADAVRVERVGGLAPSPEIQVVANGVIVADGSGTVDFGQTTPGVPVSQTITVRNLGTTNLTLGKISVPSGFTLVSTFGTTMVAPGGSTDFVVRLNAVTEGSVTGQVSFATNDADENPFNFTTTGTVSMYATPFVIDDGDSGYSATAGWSSYVGVGAQGDFSYKAAGTGSQSATWSFSGLAPGQYRVSVTWDPYSNRSIDAPYTVFDGTTSLGTVLVNQQNVPGSFTENGIYWYDLGSFAVIGNTLVIQLSDAASAGSYLIADAVRVQRIGN